MIIDIRKHIKAFPEPSKYISKKEIEERVNKVLAYMKMEIAARKIALDKMK
ncbi:hypothetical protein C900_03695 [Fulvivirga imtechensis AK7]|uniref:Uncharacterized protein n=1 Tax=Fulvivirga imtechensis AK7 TaxID=1237149 RepID=L8JNB7_9BACT|nr:hypothetical protein [Fulvivirga imtechensis]ELR70441.1 hypothetical protein C900_03695 [Fulvivirga imtechensis AK7]